MSKLEFGNDGYFFVYDLQGNLLMHPRQAQLVGTNLWSMHDPHGALTIQSLLKRLRSGGGFVEYLWERPSTHKMESKLGYVVTFDRWGWMVGTGIYLDDVNMALSANRAAGIVQYSSYAVFDRPGRRTGHGVHRRVRHCDECHRSPQLGRAIEDHGSPGGGIAGGGKRPVSRASFTMALVRCSYRSSCCWSRRLHLSLSNADRNDASGPPIHNALAQTNRTLAEIRQISHDLRPAMLDDLGLGAALRQLALEFNETGKTPHTNITVDAASSDAHPLPDAVNTALFRVAQEALTNIQRHAHASSARVTLACAPGRSS